jgi:hypothetical protein
MPKKIDIPEWAGFIISSALTEFDGSNKQEIIEKVKCTAVGGFDNIDLNRPLWNKFLEVIELKEKYLEKKKEHEQFFERKVKQK